MCKLTYKVFQSRYRLSYAYRVWGMNIELQYILPLSPTVYSCICHTPVKILLPTLLTEKTIIGTVVAAGPGEAKPQAYSKWPRTNEKFLNDKNN